MLSRVFSKKFHITLSRKSFYSNQAAFNVEGKVALITGGASGIGLAIGKALLKNGCKGIAIADIDEAKGQLALKQIADEFGNNKAIFTKCDVSRSALFDWAFKATVRGFEQVDIVINNAGILKDQAWEKTIGTNISAYLVGNLLSMQYMSKATLGCGGIVINIGSTAGLTPLRGCPIYSMSQAAIIGLTRALGKGAHVSHTGVHFMALCMGLTDTQLLKEAPAHIINDRFCAEFLKEVDGGILQDASLAGAAVMHLFKNIESGAIWVAECGEAPYKLKFGNHLELKDCAATRKTCK